MKTKYNYGEQEEKVCHIAYSCKPKNSKKFLDNYLNLSRKKEKIMKHENDGSVNNSQIN